MIRNTISILFLLVAAAQVAAVEKADSVYRLIDEAMTGVDAYFARREGRIDELKGRLSRTTGLAQRYALEFSLYEEYRGLSNDSALAYIEQAAATAALRGDKAAAGKCMALEACQCSMSGLYAEALVILDRIDLQSLDSVGLPLYYHARSDLYAGIGAHTAVPSMKRKYADMSCVYEDSLLAVTGEGDALYLQHMEKRMYAAGDYYGALRYNEKWMRLKGHVPTEFAVIAFYRYLDYKMLGDEAEWTYWLAMSALADIRNGTTDQASMWELAQHMYTTGDYARANRYIRGVREKVPYGPAQLPGDARAVGHKQEIPDRHGLYQPHAVCGFAGCQRVRANSALLRRIPGEAEAQACRRAGRA